MFCRLGFSNQPNHWKANPQSVLMLPKVDEAPHENVTLNDDGIAYYAHEGKVYQVVVFIENDEGTGVKELEADEIKELAARLLEESNSSGWSESEFYEKEPWAKGL